jgi:N-acetylglucosaminyldiphosphoundecaprenol N-acetyl-beta-D-mannosaminyltransferase
MFRPSPTPAPIPGGREGRQIRLGRLWIDALGFGEALDEIEALVRAKNGGAVFTPNVDHVVTAEDDPLFCDAYRRADLSLPDGKPLLWASRWLGVPLPAKVSGSDLVWPLMERAAGSGWRVYLLGGGPGAAGAAARRFDRELGVSIAGVDASVVPLELPSGAVDAAAERVRAARPDLVLVALGAPKQERWIDRALPRIRPAVALGVGASLDFVAGTARRSPRWMSRWGIEWLYRLAHEPGRLAYRYLVKDPRFAAIAWKTGRLPPADRWRPRRRAGAAQAGPSVPSPSSCESTADHALRR